MTQVSYADLSLNGLWKNNPAIVQLLGLCPLLAVSGSVVNSIGRSAPPCLRYDYRRSGHLYRTADASLCL